MQQKSKGTIVFAVVATVAVASTIASAGLGRGAKGRFADARATLLEGCPECDGRTRSSRVLPELRAGKVELEAARAASQTGDRASASTALVSALARADRVDGAKELVASVVAAKLIDGVVARIDADPALLDDARLAAAIRRTSFASSRRPLEGERLHALGVLANVPAQVPIRTAGFAESATTQAMEDVNTTLHRMEDATLAGNTAACETAALEPRGLARQVTVGPGICKAAGAVVESGYRLRGLRARAAARTGSRAMLRNATPG